MTFEEVRATRELLRRIAFENYQAGSEGQRLLIEAMRLMEIEMRVLDELRWQRELSGEEQETHG